MHAHKLESLGLLAGGIAHHGLGLTTLIGIVRGLGGAQRLKARWAGERASWWPSPLSRSLRGGRSRARFYRGRDRR